MKRVLIVGAGDAGTSLRIDLEKNGDKIIGFLDDDVTKPNVLGSLQDINYIIREFSISDVFIALPSIENSKKRDVLNLIDPNIKININIIPGDLKLLSKPVATIGDLEELNIEKLLGHAPKKKNVMNQVKFFKNKTVLISGAAGSIGSEIVNQISQLSFKKVIAVDWWENGMFDLQYKMKDRTNIQYVIASIQNEKRLQNIFDRYQPDIVLHAAAYKHVPMMESNSIEAYNNNVGGTYNIFKTSAINGVKDVIYISTDKAVNPTNIMGSTKRLGEFLMKQFSKDYPNTNFRAVRFGNVIGSNGSVIPLFQKQISQGGPITVTDENITRFFMSIPEAVHLVLNSIFLPGGSIYVLDMGEQVKIIDIAKFMNRFYGNRCEIKIVGLRPGEKMYEELSYDPDKVCLTDQDFVYEAESLEEYFEENLCNTILEILGESKQEEIVDRDLRTKMRSIFKFNV